MRYFKGTIIISIEYSQPSILSMVLYIFLTLKFAVIQFCRHTFNVFQNTSHREKNFLSKQLYFQSSYLNQLLLSNTYFLKIITFSAQLLFWKRLLFRISNYLQHLLFRSGYVFRTVNFSEEKPFLRASIS